MGLLGCLPLTCCTGLHIFRGRKRQQGKQHWQPGSTATDCNSRRRTGSRVWKLRLAKAEAVRSETSTRWLTIPSTVSFDESSAGLDSPTIPQAPSTGAVDVDMNRSRNRNEEGRRVVRGSGCVRVSQAVVVDSHSMDEELRQKMFTRPRRARCGNCPNPWPCTCQKETARSKTAVRKPGATYAVRKHRHTGVTSWALMKRV